MANLKLRWTKIALSDLEHVFNFISNEDHPDTARLMIKKIINAVDQLCNFPETGRKGRVEGTRELVVLKNPFIIVYRINKGAIEILTILHHARMWV